jgi:hypothetical protein
VDPVVVSAVAEVASPEVEVVKASEAAEVGLLLHPFLINTLSVILTLVYFRFRPGPS